MKSIQASTYPIHFEDIAYTELAHYLAEKQYSSVFILVDEHTKECCYPIICNKIPSLSNAPCIEISAGEEYKTIETCLSVWYTLTALGADRSSLLITLGGGVITDLGGFVASTFKRGIDFINIPTTLLSMVDASVGGKTGVDLGVLKNQVGVFANPQMVLVDLNYLKTLPQRELRSGMAEIIKYGLTFNMELFVEAVHAKTHVSNTLVYKSIAIKNEVVSQDPKEKGIRKSLNYGHTLGHALESYFLSSSTKETLTHGEAIAIGMICETYISSKHLGYSKKDCDTISKGIISLLGKVPLIHEDFDPIIANLKHDKKNKGGQVLFVLLRDKEVVELAVQVPDSLIRESLQYYMDLTFDTVKEA